MIQQYTNIFDEEQIKFVWEHLTKPNWQFWHTSNPESKNFFWYMDLKEYSFFTQNLFSKIKKNIGDDFFIKTVYANGQTFGLDGEFHIDDEDEKSFTFLYYPMLSWDISWGGETVILDLDGEVHSLYPIPNSAILFPSKWIHYGKSPSKSFTDLRVTVAYKLKKL
jgi:hypothetical protein